MSKDELARNLIEKLSRPIITLSESEKDLIKSALIEYLKRRYKKSSLIADKVPPD